MSLNQLKSLYRFSDLPYSLDPASIQTLKQVVLLRIKSSENGWIELDGERLSKSDVLKIFESDFSRNSFDADDLWETFPELKGIASPSTLRNSFRGNKENFLNYEHTIEVQNYLSEKYAVQLERAIRKNIQSLELLQASQRSSFLFAFNDETRMRIKKNLQLEIRQLLEKSESNISFNFLAWTPYYKIMEVIAGDDQDFLLLQYNKGLKQLSSLAYDQGSTFFKRQLGLPFSSFVRDQIVAHEKEFFALNKAARTGSSSDSSISGRAVLIGAVILFKVIFIIARCNSSSTSYSYTPTNPDPEMMRKIREYQENPQDYISPGVPRPPEDQTDPGSDSVEFQP